MVHQSYTVGRKPTANFQREFLIELHTIFFYFSFRSSLRTDLMVHQSNTAGRKPTLSPAEQKRLIAKANDMSEIMFNTIGACFNQLQTPSTNIQGMVSSYLRKRILT